MIKISKSKREALTSRLTLLIDKYNQQYEEYIEPLVIERRLLYEADRERYRIKYPKLSEISDATATDVHDVIEWTMPPLMRIIFSSNDVISLRGMTEKDDASAKIMERLITYQITRNNEGFIKFYDWFKSSLIDNFGVLKCWWEYEEISETHKATVSDDELYGQHPQQMMMQAMQQMGLPSDPNQIQQMMAQAPPEVQQQVQQAIQQIQQRFAGLPEIEGLVEKKNIIIESMDTLAENVNVVRYKVIQEISKNQPDFCILSPSEFRFDTQCKDIRNSDLLIHRMVVNGDWLHRMEREGMLENVDKAIKEYGANDNENKKTEFDRLMRKEVSDLSEVEVLDDEKAKQEYVYYECWYNTDINDDGILEKLVVGMLGKTIIRLEENTLGEHPFFIIMPIREPHRLIARTGIAELVGEIQDMKTCMIRQMISGVSQANDRQVFVKEDALIDVAELAEGAKAVRVTENPQDVIFTMPWNAIDTSTIPLLELLAQMKEDRTGITKYSMGMADPRANMLDINTLMPMADGTLKALEILEDNDMILGSNGLPTKVIKVHDIKYPKCAYKMEFSDGSVINAGEEHLWTVQKNYENWKTITTQDIVNDKNNEYFVPRIQKPVGFGTEKELPIDPYVLGLWLGDGNSNRASITTEDEEIVNYLKDIYGEENVKPENVQNSGNAITYSITNGLYSELNSLNLISDHGQKFEKHIPLMYFSSSYGQKMELLRGLMDTDGMCSKAGQQKFCQSYNRLLEDVKLLLGFLGIIYKTVNYEAKDKIIRGKVVHSRAYQVVMFGAHDCPFRLERKAKRFKPTNRKRIKITSITPIDNMLMRCITVEAKDGLYAVGTRLICSHNTATEASITQNNASTRIEMLVRMCIEGAGGVKDLFRFLIKLNQANITKDTTVRIAGEDFIIQPEDLSGRINIEVNTGLALDSKSERFQNLNFLMNIYPTAIQAGIANQGHAAFAFQKLVEEMGYKDVSHFCYQPEEAVQTAQQNAQAAQQAAQQQAQMESQADLEKANITANASIKVAEIREHGAMERQMLQFKQALDQSNADYEHELRAGSIQDIGRDRRQISASVPIKDVPAKAQVQLLNQIGVDIDESDVEGKIQGELNNELKVKRAGQGTKAKTATSK